MNITKILSKYINKTLIQYNIPKKLISLIQVTSQSKNSHYQINGILQISKFIKIDTINLCKKIISNIENKKIIKKIQYSEPGFINIFLSELWISKQLNKIIYCKRIGIPIQKKKTIIIDYSSPNMAKEMHVGHLRSTILGDAMVRILKFLGHNIIRMNHIGDWGTQFGMILAFIKKKYKTYKNLNISLKKLEKFYKKSKILYKNNSEFQKQSDKCLINLQKKKPQYISIWKKIINITIQENNKIYKLLNITLNDKHIFGESFYLNMIPNIIEELKKKNIAITKQKKVIIYIDELKNKEGKTMGVIIQKNNNSFLYSTIDLACVKYRNQVLKADRIIYYTDIRQKQHLQQIKIISKKAGYISDKCNFEHHIFGMVLSKENKPFKTREGKSIKLKQLIKESINRSIKILKKKTPNLKKKKILHLSKTIGISAIKYSDLSKNRVKNYVFDWNNMLSFNGNTAMYIQYTYTRIQSIIKKSKIKFNNIETEILPKKKIEIKLSIKFLQFEEIIIYVAKYGKPHILCLYLFKISCLFSSFYEKYPIIYAKKIKIKKSRLKISFITAKIIKKGMKILGIPVIKNI